MTAEHYKLSPKVTLETCAVELKSLLAHLSQRDLLLDAADTVDVDSSAISLMLETQRAAARLGRTWHLLGLSPHLTKLIQLYGLEQLLWVKSGTK